MPAKSDVLTKSYFKREMDALARSIAKGFEDVERRLGARIDKIEHRLDSLEARIGTLERRFDAFLEEITAIRKKLAAKPTAIELDKLEKRVRVIERVLHIEPASASR